MKQEYHCTWGKIELIKDGAKWDAQAYGKVPKKIKDTIKTLQSVKPQPDYTMAHFVIKKTCGDDLLYVKTEAENAGK